MADKKNKSKEIVYAIISEVALFSFLYYVQLLLNVGGNLWLSTLILWALLNISIVLCPVIRKCYK